MVVHAQKLLDTIINTYYQRPNDPHNMFTKDIISVISYDQYPSPQHAITIYKHILSTSLSLAKTVLESDLLIWWADGNDHFLPKRYIKYKTNLLALVLACSCTGGDEKDKIKILLFSR